MKVEIVRGTIETNESAKVFTLGDSSAPPPLSPPSRKRVHLDAYQTDPRLAMACVAQLGVAGKTCWEPHCGDGAFVTAMLEAGARRVYASDIDSDAKAILDGQGFVADFLDATSPTRDLDWIIGNPPFQNFEGHVHHALDLAPRVAFLLRLAAMESQRRASLWRIWPLRHVYVLARRPSFIGGATDSCAYGFFVFSRGFAGPATITPGWEW